MASWIPSHYDRPRQHFRRCLPMFTRGIRVGQDDTTGKLHGYRRLLALYGNSKCRYRRSDAYNAPPRGLEPEYRRLRQNSLNSHLPPRNHVSPSLLLSPHIIKTPKIQNIT